MVTLGLNRRRDLSPDAAAAIVVERALMYVAFEAGLRLGPCGMT